MLLVLRIDYSATGRQCGDTEPLLALEPVYLVTTDVRFVWTGEFKKKLQEEFGSISMDSCSKATLPKRQTKEKIRRIEPRLSYKTAKRPQSHIHKSTWQLRQIEAL